eukprot:6639444-Prymnesium_polylepis.1
MVTMPLFQSTSHPANDDSIACMNGRPFHTTCEANTSLPKRTASSPSGSPPTGSSAHDAVIAQQLHGLTPPLASERDPALPLH